jgi:hypothetical protein
VSLFHWAMRNAAGLLFAVAVILLMGGLIPFLYDLGATIARRPSGYGMNEPTDWSLLTMRFQSAFAGAIWPLFGAAVLYRWDRREQTRATFGATHD